MNLETHETRIEETIKDPLICGKGDKMGCTSTQAVNIVARWKTWDAYSRFLVDKRHLVRNGEKLTIQNVQAEINGVYIGNTKKAGLFSHLKKLFENYKMTSFSSVLF